MSNRMLLATCAAWFFFCTQLQAQNNKPLPQLGKSPIKEVIAAMTLEEKAHMVVGMGMRFGPPPAARRDSSNRSAAPVQNGPVIGHTQDKVPGAAGTTFAIP